MFLHVIYIYIIYIKKIEKIKSIMYDECDMCNNMKIDDNEYEIQQTSANSCDCDEMDVQQSSSAYVTI